MSKTSIKFAIHTIKKIVFLKVILKDGLKKFRDDNLYVTFDHFVCERNIFGGLVIS